MQQVQSTASPIHNYYENGPALKQAKPDDVIIHYRCGDVLMGASGYFLYPKFVEYARLISPEARSIGIFTQPFSSKGVTARNIDKLDQSGDRCSVLVHGLIDFLKERFPKAE